MTFTLTLDQVEPRDRDRVGGKGYSLSRMAREGLPIPGALLIDEEAYRHFIRRTGIGESIALEINRKIVDQMRGEELWGAALRVRNLFLRTPLADEIREELAREIESRFRGLSVGRSCAAKASFSGLWVYREDHTEARILGALAAIKPEFLALDAVCQAVKEAEWGSDLKVASAGKAYERLETRLVRITEGNTETPFSFEKPKWWEMREGVTIPAIPVGKPLEGGKGYAPERNPYFKKFTSRTMRPVIDFDACVKCTLCWLQCPDSVYDVTPDGFYDADMEACCGCGVC